MVSIYMPWEWHFLLGCFALTAPQFSLIIISNKNKQADTDEVKTRQQRLEELLDQYASENLHPETE